MIAHFSDVPEDVALRVYSSRILGQDPALVLHGGGNTSVKSTVADVFGDPVDVLFVKGSGWNLADLEPKGLPAVRLDVARRLAALPHLSDEAMVNAQRCAMLDASSPNPSIETVVHAIMPGKFVDHSHADAILALTNHPNGLDHVRAALGDDVAIVPYVKPGFDLAKAAWDVLQAHPQASAMVLHKHGLFTWGPTAKDSYDQHIELVTRAQDYLRSAGAQDAVPVTDSVRAAAREEAAALAPALRGALGGGVLHWVDDAEAIAWCHHPDIRTFCATGPLTPDHIIRTRQLPMVLERDQDPLLAVHNYSAAYLSYFARGASRTPGLTCLTPIPRWIVVPGLGLFSHGPDLKTARVVADIARHTLRVKGRASVLGPWEGLNEDELFDIEYWSLEQAKLGRGTPPPLKGKIAVVTGGSGAIGAAVADQLAADGAVVVTLDQKPSPGSHVALEADVTDSLEPAFREIAARYGGVDIVVASAGVAHVAPLSELAAEDLRRLTDINLIGVHHTIQAAARLFKTQGIGGDIVLISTKNVMAPGADFGAYSASKAGAHQLAKIAALELAGDDVRVNMVTPDAVFGDAVPSGLWQEVGPARAASKGIPFSALEGHYQSRNLLKAPVTAADVGRAVAFFARRDTPTTGASLPVDGGVPGAFPR